MKVLALLVAALVLLPSPARADDVVLDGVTVHAWDRTQQVVTVNHTGGFHARLTWWRYDDGRWVRKLQAAGRIGYGGLVAGARRVQGSGTTPLGSYRLLEAFGTHDADPAWRSSYRRIGPGDYWVEDNQSAYYNRWRNRRDGGFRWWMPDSNVNASELLTDRPVDYEYAINTSFNQDQVRYRGAGIFLHVNGAGATAGCVSGPRWFLRSLMRRLDPASVPMIAIGR